MTIKRVLALGTYPIVKPVHGGQRRVAAIRDFYKRIGIDFIYACVYDPSVYAPPLVSTDDIPLVSTSEEYGPLALTGDLLSGRQLETHEPSWRHFVKTVERIQPDALQLEQPFMWPLARRLRGSFARRLPLIYSSHNVEAPLKRAIMAGGGMPRDLCDRTTAIVENIEAEICQDSSLIISVSASDADCYRKFARPIVIVPNGVDRPPATRPDERIVRSVFGSNRFMFMVGSAYGPNVEGFCQCVVKDGMFFCPPVKSIAVCGGVSDGIYSHPDYQRFVAAHNVRVEFFPRIDDSDLWALKNASHGAMLPILSGGGSNLKSAEALALGKWVVATPTALRGFEAFRDAEGVIVASDHVAFRRAIAHVLRSPPIEISEQSREAREGLYWDALFEKSALGEHLARL